MAKYCRECLTEVPDHKMSCSTPEPTSPSIDRYSGAAWNSMYEECSKVDVMKMWMDQWEEKRKLEIQCARHEADAERLAKDNRELKEELIRRNQDIEGLQLTNRNLSRKIVEDRKKREFVGGVHGS